MGDLRSVELSGIRPVCLPMDVMESSTMNVLDRTKRSTEWRRATLVGNSNSPGSLLKTTTIHLVQGRTRHRFAMARQGALTPLLLPYRSLRLCSFLAPRHRI